MEEAAGEGARRGIAALTGGSDAGSAVRCLGDVGAALVVREGAKASG